ncbi:MAG TPA: methionine--tRNA ligase [Methanomicrobia archaeon]|nr:methionine--tRNA ligase [Methanomicrobia archaeon]HEX59604.1 methionine--tRNA ligase [Methanomicrobia archaeon]
MKLNIRTPGRPVLVTCGLPYVNGECHIGHLRTYVPADVYVRMLRKLGHDVVFICGSDTHGTPIVLSAEARGTSPKALVEEYHKHFKEIFKQLNISFDHYGSTDDETNHKRTQEIVKALIESGYVYPKRIKLAFCPRCDRFLPDRYVEGICPYCGAAARGDECDQGCGRHLEPGEIREPVCKVCGSRAEFREQEHFFFKLSAFKDFLLDFLEKLDGTENARNYASEWVKRELRDWCITRNLDWGVRFPGRDDLVVYVWVDAPIGYISFTEELAAMRGFDWRTFWKDGGVIIHFIGADIIYHHCIFWPAMLKGARYSTPDAVVASGMVTINSKPLSKTRGNVVWTKDFLEKFDADTLRYYLVAYTSHTKELDFSWRAFQERVNNELVAILGNLIHRVISFAYRNFGAVPDGEISEDVFTAIKNTKEVILEALEEYEFKKLVDSAMSLAGLGNTIFQRSEPWHLIKGGDEDVRKGKSVVRSALQIIKATAIFLEPVMPSKMEKVWEFLGMEGDVHAAPLDEALVEIKAGQKLKKPEILFPKVGDDVVVELESKLPK